MDAERKAKAQAKRDEIKKYIQEERDTVLKKWMALEQQVHHEDQAREIFYDTLAKDKTRAVPVTVQKFLGSLKKSVKHTMRYKGGTPYSIVRNMFLYWDSEKCGTLNPNDLHRCMQALGVQMNEADSHEVVLFYKSADSTFDAPRLNYGPLLQDLSRGEPSIITSVKDEEETEEEKAMRFVSDDDKYAVKPQLIKDFLEATRSVIKKKMVLEGGTPYSHVRHCFLMFDWNYSNALDPEELEKAARINLGLHCTPEVAEKIVDYYDRKKVGEMDYNLLLKDLLEEMKGGLIEYKIESKEAVEAEKKRLSRNPFIPTPFAAPPNKTLEMFKRRVKMYLSKKVKACGGSIDNWVREAFLQYDPKYTGMVERWEDLRGACRRFGFVLTPDEAKCIMEEYNATGNGSIEYRRIIDDLLQGEAHFMSDPSAFKDPSEPATSRMPKNVRRAIAKLSVAVNTFARHSNGIAAARDMLHGTLLRFDKNQMGKLSLSAFAEACKALHAKLLPEEMSLVLKWFDSNGSGYLDIEQCTTQLAGSDCLTRPISLPPVQKPFVNTHLMHTAGDNFGASMTSSAHHGMKFGGMPGKATKEMQSLRKRFLLREKRVSHLSEEKQLIEQKLKDIEVQRKKIMDKHHEKHAVVDPYAIRK